MAEITELSKEEMRDVIKFYDSFKSKLDLDKILADSDVRFLFMIEKKEESWVYSNELPDYTLVKFISELFFHDKRLMDTVMKRYDFIKKVFDASEPGIETESEQESDPEKEQKEPIEEKPEPIKQSEPAPDPKPDDYLTPKDIEKTYQISTKTLANWRSQGRGPEFFKLGNKVRYLRKNVDKWVEQSRRKIYQSK